MATRQNTDLMSNAPGMTAAQAPRAEADDMKPRDVRADGALGEGAAMNGTESTHVIVWSILSSPRGWNVPITVPNGGERGGSTTKVSRTMIYPGENVIERGIWTEMLNRKYYQSLVDEGMIGEGRMPKIHLKNSFDMVKGELHMAPANKRDIGILCPLSKEVDETHRERKRDQPGVMRLITEDDARNLGL